MALPISTLEDISGLTESNEEPVAYIIAIHGLRGCSNDRWNNSGWWKGRSPERYRILSYHYSPWNRHGRIFTRKSATDEAIELLDRLMQLPICGKDKKPPTALIFLAQDLGGIIAKEALSIASSKAEKQYADIVNCTISMILIGSPQRFRSKPELHKALSHLLEVQLWDFPPLAWEISREMAEWVVDVNDTFVETKAPLTISFVAFVSSHADPKSHIFDKFYASSLLASEDLVYEFDCSHEDLVRNIGCSIDRIIINLDLEVQAFSLYA